MVEDERQIPEEPKLFGAGDGAQTRDLCLGKASLYQLSYSRVQMNILEKQNYSCQAREVNANLKMMKKLIWMMVLGVLFFIGGQWLGLMVSPHNQERAVLAELPPPAAASAEVEKTPAQLPNKTAEKKTETKAPQAVKPKSAQKSGASLRVGPVSPKPSLKPRPSQKAQSQPVVKPKPEPIIVGKKVEKIEEAPPAEPSAESEKPAMPEEKSDESGAPAGTSSGGDGP